MSLKSTLAGVAGALVMAGAGADWWYSPYLELHALQTAVKASDMETFNEHVDYDKLKESLTQQLTTALMPVAEKQMEGKGRDPLAAAGAQLGTSLGMMLVGPMVNALMTPEALMRAMHQGSFKETRKGGAASASTEPGDVQWIVARRSADTVVLHDGGDKPMTFIFTRAGFANWKLSGVELPPGILAS